MSLGAGACMLVGSGGAAGGVDAGVGAGTGAGGAAGGGAGTPRRALSASRSLFVKMPCVLCATCSAVRRTLPSMTAPLADTTGASMPKPLAACPRL